MATTVKLKAVRKPPPSKEEEAEVTLETVQEIINGINEGVFDAYLDIIFKAFDDRIRKSQEEDGDGELPARDRVEKLRPIRVEREPVVPVAGRSYRVRGEQYQGVVVEYLEMAGANSRGAAVVLVKAVIGNMVVTTGKQYKIPLIALEEIPDLKSKPLPNVPDAPKCRKCGKKVEYSGRGRPRALCDDCARGRNRNIL